MRRARILTEEGRVQERLRIAGVLRRRIAAASAARLALHPVMPQAYWPAEEAMRRAERRLREAEADEPVARPAPVRPVKPGFIARLGRRLSSRSAGAEPTPAEPARESEALRDARRDRDAARRRLAAIRHAHERAVAATRADRAARFARLDGRIVRAEAALHLLGGDEGWTVRGLRALLREARGGPHHPGVDDAPDHDGEDPDDGPVGPALP